MPLDLNRVQKELRDIARDTASGVSIEPRGGGSVSRLLGCLAGPRDTPYEGGRFFVDIELPDDYPFAPPRMRFETRVWHPNVSSASGAICLDILRDAWSPALTLKTALLSLQALLSSPAPDDPQDAVVARQFLSSRAEFDATARAWARMYAGEPGRPAGEDEKVARLAEAGFDPGAARAALVAARGDEFAAMDALLGGG